MNKLEIAKTRKIFIQYYEEFLKEQYNYFGLTIENSIELRKFENKIEKIYLLDNNSFYKFIYDIHPGAYILSDGYVSINSDGLIDVFFWVLKNVNKKNIYDNICFNKNGKNYIITTLSKNIKSNIKTIIRIITKNNTILSQKIYSRKNIYIINLNIDGNAFELIKDEQEFKNFDFDNNDYENGENGLYLNPKNINFVSLDTLKKDGIIN